MYGIEKVRKIYIRGSRRKNDIFYYIFLDKDGDKIGYVINKNYANNREVNPDEVEEFLERSPNVKKEISDNIKHGDTLPYITLFNSIVLVCSFPENNCIISFDVPKRKPMNRFGQASDGLNEMKKLTRG